MTALTTAVYGHIPRGLLAVAEGAIQCSPQVPNAVLLEAMASDSLAAITVHAPPGTIERRAVLAMALRALAPGGNLSVLAANTKGGTRLASELAAFGCAPAASHKRHHQVVTVKKPERLIGIDEAIAAAAPRLLPALALWSRPGIFNWDSIDPGSQLLIDHLPKLTGRGADLGCGIGVLARAVRQHADAPHMTLIDIDQRALDLARRNVPGDGVTLLWADVRAAQELPKGLDFVVCNPPFHDAGEEDKALGQAFISKAAAMLKNGGELWLTANRHLPYEATLQPLFEAVERVAQTNGFKIYRARKAIALGASAAKKARR